MSSGGCCPPGAWPYLESAHIPEGTDTVLPGVEFYQSGDAASCKGKALIVCPDVWGYHGGKTRSVCDYFSKQGYFVVAPKFLVPPLDGGTDGDGLAPDFSDWSKFPSYMGLHSWDGTPGSWKPKMLVIKAHLESLGITSCSMIGFCFGGLVVCKTLADPELASPFFKAGAIAHPSMVLEEKVYGGNTAALMAKVGAPLLLMPCIGDSEKYDKGGEWRSPVCETFRFPEMAHGFVVRGDEKDEAICKAQIQALEMMSAFLAK